MPLNIIVCIKNTPTTLNVSVDSTTGKVKREGLALAMSPYDEYGVEEAIRLKERVPGSTATALTVGPEGSDSVVREAIARGCDGGAFVCVPELADSNPYAASLILAAAIKKLNGEKPVHLVLFGKNTNDGNSGLVGSMTAAQLGWPGVLSVKKIDAIDEKSAVVWRAMEDGLDIVKTSLPAAISTVKEINEPRLPSLKGKMASKKAVIPKWTVADLDLAAEAPQALAASTTLRSSPPPSRPSGVKIEGATGAEKAKKLVDLLFERKLV